MQKKAGYEGYHKLIKEKLPIRIETVSTNYDQKQKFKVNLFNK